jgi:thiamine biosynthesis lipoprotein
MKRSQLLLIFLFGLAGVLIIWAAIRPNPLQHFIYEGFDTWIEIDLPSRHQSLSQNIAAIIQELDEKWDRFDQRSEVWKINQNQEPIEISNSTCDLILRAQELQNLTEGFFNIFLGSLMDEWSFNNNPRLPSPDRIQVLTEQVANSTIFINKETKNAQRIGQGKIDLGGIAKGYLVDKIIIELEKKQISPALVNAGGTVFALGKKFRVGILHPRQESLVGLIEVKDQAVSTSGDYYRFFEQEGIRYYHIINPYTGYSSGYFSSVTVVYPNAADADAISTAVMAGGPKLIPIVERRFPGVAIIAIQSDEKLIMNNAALKIFQKDSTDKIHP